MVKINPNKITRVEVIGDGREYVTTDRVFQGLLIQDQGRTLKIFLSPEEKYKPLKEQMAQLIKERDSLIIKRGVK